MRKWKFNDCMLNSVKYCRCVKNALQTVTESLKVEVQKGILLIVGL